MAAAASHTLGSKVWVNDAVEGWVKGDVVKVEKGTLKVSTEKGSIRAYKPEECPLQNPQTAGGVEVRLPISPSSSAGPQTGTVLASACTYSASAVLSTNCME